ncbi:hypothetical protein V5799_033736 [Amblyomma americanum]|uniref:Secreted protein n=1 Tax=Amblyomma americanum TaxID=6943 RepID=A0AAQ4DMG5_AMBAM
MRAVRLPLPGFLLLLPWLLAFRDGSGAVAAPGNCSETYLRYHQNHTMCRPEPACAIQVAGIDDSVKQLILKLHNHYRSLIAGGNETHMPPASNMLEVVSPGARIVRTPCLSSRSGLPSTMWS